MADHNDFGKAGEWQAVEYLRSQGYLIRDTNWRSGHKELDIVAEKDGTLVVVEVKSRASTRFGRPQDAVSPMKIRRTVAAADAYVRCYRIDLPIRFDVITIVATTGRMEHIEDAFRSPVWYR